MSGISRSAPKRANWIAPGASLFVFDSLSLDCLLHHSTTLSVKGESYRLEEKRRARLLGRTHTSPEAEKEVLPVGDGGKARRARGAGLASATLRPISPHAAKDKTTITGQYPR